MVDLPVSCCTEVGTLNAAAFELHMSFIESKQSQGHKARRPAHVVQPSGRNHPARVGQFASKRLRISVAAQALPNPSLEPTRSGMAPWPRGFHAYHPPRGQGATPPRSAQLKR